MATTEKLIRVISFAIALTGLMLGAGRSARADGVSDRVQVIGPDGNALFDVFIPDEIGSNEGFAIFQPGGRTGLGPPTGLLALVPPGAPGLSYVILAEPPDEPVDPTELPPTIYPGPNGPVTVSDLLINGIANQAGVPPFIAFISDNDPELQDYVSAIQGPVPVITETGQLQDLTAPAGVSIFPGIGPIDIKAQSDAVSSAPLPTSLCGGAALLGLAAFSSLRRRRRCAA